MLSFFFFFPPFLCILFCIFVPVHELVGDCVVKILQLSSFLVGPRQPRYLIFIEWQSKVFFLHTYCNDLYEE